MQSTLVKTVVKHIGMTVNDMERSLHFYTEVLPCCPVSDESMTLPAQNDLPESQVRVVQMQLGDEIVELTEYLNRKGRAIPEDSRSNDRWVQHLAIVVRDMEQAYQHLVQHGVTKVSNEPQTLPKWNLAAGDIQAFSFKDVEGHDLQLIHFPEGKGDTKWHNSTDLLFLGIDHTAIVVSNTDESRAFYSLLGLELEQDSKHVGLEQERLSDLPRVQTRTTAMRGSEGMRVKLVEYLNPAQGRTIPDDTSGNDLWSWQTTIAVEDLSAIAQELEQKNYQVYPFQSASTEQEAESSFLVRDPDGHRVLLVKR